MQRLTVGALFAEAEAFENAGMITVWQVDNDRDGEWWEGLASVDVVFGGPPRPVGRAWQQDGDEDGRNVWSEYLRVIQELRPDWVVIENKLGVAAGILDEILSDLEGQGYEATAFDIPACGVSRREYRIFVVGHARADQERKRFEPQWSTPLESERPDAARQRRLLSDG